MEAKERNKVLVLLFAGVLMGALDIAIVGPALPAIQEEFAVGSRQMAWVFNIYVLFSLVSTPLMAKLSDRFGRRSIYILDVALFGAGSLMVALADSYAVLLAGRAVQAIGAGGILPVAAAVIGDTFPVEKRGGALGLIGAVFGMAFLIGPILAGFILKFASWHWLFLINLPIGLLLILAAARMLPSTRPAERKPFDLAGVLVLSVLLSALAYGVTALDPTRPLLGLMEPGIGGYLLVAFVLAPVFWRLENKAADPVLQPRLFRSRQMVIAGILATGTGMAETSGVFLPSMAVTGLGMTPSQASFWMIPTVIALMIGSPLAGRLLDRIGSKVIVQAGLLLTAIGFYLFAYVGTHMVWFVVGQLLSGLGLAALLGAPLRYVVLSEAPVEQRGAAQGLLVVVLSIGQLSGAALVGAIASAVSVDRPEGFQQGFLVIGVVMSLTVLLAFGLKNRAAERATANATAG
ncbi:MAG: MFS transporter [Gammaproteobacteria bacterium]|nr:MAG: MFS transporter [Gammaproteobacteria bacterium]